MAKTSEGRAKSLKLSREYVTWMYDIVMDYTLQLAAAEKYYQNEVVSLEGLLKAAETKEAADEVVKALDALKRDKVYVDIAKQRHTELKGVIEDFLQVEPAKDVTPADLEGIMNINTTGDVEVHPANEEVETIQGGETTGSTDEVLLTDSQS